MATMHPERVRKLVLTSSGVAMTPEEHRAMLRHWNVKDAAELLLPMDVKGVRKLLDLAYHNPPPVPDWILRQTLTVSSSSRMPRVFTASLLRQHDMLQCLFHDMALSSSYPFYYIELLFEANECCTAMTWCN